MLMMVDPHVHFHVIPRYASQRDFLGLSFVDQDWPKPPDLSRSCIENIDKYFEITSKGNWENKIILVEKEKPTKEILNKLLEIRSKRNKPFFDDKTQLDLNCLMISALISSSEILSDKGYLQLAEEFFAKIENKYILNNI